MAERGYKSFNEYWFRDYDVTNLRELHYFIEWMEDLLHKFGYRAVHIVYAYLLIDDYPDREHALRYRVEDLADKNLRLKTKDVDVWNVVSRKLFGYPLMEIKSFVEGLGIEYYDDTLRKMCQLFNKGPVCGLFLNDLTALACRYFNLPVAHTFTQFKYLYDTNWHFMAAKVNLARCPFSFIRHGVYRTLPFYKEASHMLYSIAWICSALKYAYFRRLLELYERNKLSSN